MHKFVTSLSMTKRQNDKEEPQNEFADNEFADKV
jgi:hypothetical protein